MVYSPLITLDLETRCFYSFLDHTDSFRDSKEAQKAMHVKYVQGLYNSLMEFAAQRPSVNIDRQDCCQNGSTVFPDCSVFCYANKIILAAWVG